MRKIDTNIAAIEAQLTQAGLFTPVPIGQRRGRCLMVVGTASDVGKSLLVAGLCRAYANRGLRVLPFKAQNMSNNAAVTVDADAPANVDGSPVRGEIGRAQALQARACRAERSVHMNPVLLKPENDIDCQVVLRGRVLGRSSASDYQRLKPGLMPAVLDSLERLRQQADLVIVEGAGSGGELYLRPQDISNMGLAEAADLPVLLLADESRGGVTAAVLGHHLLWSESERARVEGFVVNKFRGDPSVFAPAADTITAATGWPMRGLVRWFEGARRLPQEDSLALDAVAATSQRATGQHALTVAVLRLSRVANFDDLDPLAAESGVNLLWVQPGEPIPRNADVVVVPGSKATRTDLVFLRDQGWDHDLIAHVRHGGHVVGLCGGFQMLGSIVSDPQGVEGPPGDTKGLGLLDIQTVMGFDKRLVEIDCLDLASGTRVTGFEMHIGRTTGPDMAHPWLRLVNVQGVATPEGAVSTNGRVMGTYLHGVFEADGFRRNWLARMSGAILAATSVSVSYHARVEENLDAYAVQLECDMDLNSLFALAR
jgi:adenosylcobyric acid synthase